jgi:hypothetical protein
MSTPCSAPRVAKACWACCGNLGFVVLLGAIYALGAYLHGSVFTPAYSTEGYGPMGRLGLTEAFLLWAKASMFAPFAGFINALLLAACVRVAWQGTYPWWGRALHGLAHGLLHGCLIFGLAWGFAQVLPEHLGGRIAGIAAVGLAGAVCGSLLFGLYLALLGGPLRQLPDNAFGSVAWPHHKGFLRMRIDAEGLHVHVLGIDKVPVRDRQSLGFLPSGWRVVDRFTLRKPRPLAASDANEATNSQAV